MLQKQLVPVQFGALDEKTESKQLAPGGMTRVVNAERNKSGRYDKRTGYSATSTTYLDSGGSSTASNLKALGTTGNSMFALDGDDSGDYRILGYSENTAKLADKGEFIPTTVTAARLSANNSNNVLMSSCASNSNYTCIAWTEITSNTPTNTFLIIQILDNATQDVVAQKSYDQFSRGCVQVVEFGDKFHIFAQSGSNEITEYTWDASSPTTNGTTIATEGVVASDMEGSSCQFIVKDSGTYLVILYPDTGNVMQLSRSTGNGTWTSLVNSQAGYRPVGMVFDDSENIYTFAVDSGGDRDYAIYDIDGTVLKANTTFPLGGEGLISGVSTGSGSILYWYNYNSSGTPLLYVGTADTAGLLSSFPYAQWVHIASEGWTRNGKHYFLGLYKSTVQPTYFVFEVTTSRIRPVAKIAQKEGPNTVNVGDDTEYGNICVSNIGQQSDDIYTLPILRANGLTEVGGSLVNKNGCALTTLTYKTTDELPHVPLGSSALIGGGILSLYDGEGIYENGFNIYPEIVSLAESNSTGSIPNGTYSYKLIFEWTDARGGLHRSEPSVATSITTTGSNDTVTITFRELGGLTRKSNVRVVAYRTEAGGSTYYRLDVGSDPLTTSTIVDGATDSEININEILYDNGGELANQQPPACGHLSVYKNRVWVSGLEDGSRVWYSKLRQTNNDPYSFNEALQLTVGDAERVKASQALDDKLCFFKERQLLYTYGEGPNNTGDGGTFAEPVDVNFDGGIAEPASLVKFPQGIIFKHQRGFYAMGADLNPVYIGKNVEDFNDETVTSAVLIPSKNQIRWTHSAGSILAYDYFHQQWYEYSDLQCSGGTIRDGKHVVVSSNAIYEQDDSAWTDGGTSYNFLVQTGWISFAGLSGFKRVYKIFFEAQYKADHDLTITVDMEQDGTVYTDTYTVDAATVSGGTDTYRWEVALSRQKCSSIRVKIEDTSLAGTEQSLNIINMSMLVGLKAGGAKYASSKQVG